MAMVMGIMKTCFKDCVNDFRTSELAGGEKTCIINCCKRNASSYEEVAHAQ